VVATHFDSQDCSRRFLIRPNRSLSWSEMVRFYLGMLGVSFGIAIAFALKGAWLVLPFAGLEMLALGIALYMVARRGSDWQMISIREDEVAVVEHSSKHEYRQTFQRAWAKVELERAMIRGYPSKLVIRSHGRSLELGGCLNEADKKYLARELNAAIRANP
jgi:uncharacterized membrane protein